MKRSTGIFVFILAVFHLTAAPVGADLAGRVALNFYHERSQGGSMRTNTTQNATTSEQAREPTDTGERYERLVELLRQERASAGPVQALRVQAPGIRPR